MRAAARRCYRRGGVSRRRERESARASRRQGQGSSDTAPRYWSLANALLAALALAIKSARPDRQQLRPDQRPVTVAVEPVEDRVDLGSQFGKRDAVVVIHVRSEEHTSELQSLVRHSYAVFCLKK